MLVYEFISIYIAGYVSEYIVNLFSVNTLLKNISFSSLYIFLYALLNNLSFNKLFYKQQFNWLFLLLPITALILNKQLTFNPNINSIFVESFAASIVEESLFRTLIPNNFKNYNIGILVSGLLFGIVHIKSKVSFDTFFKIMTSSMLFNIICFLFKPNNVLFHFLWNLITISLFSKQTETQEDNQSETPEDSQGETPEAIQSETTLTDIETSNITIIMFVIVILVKMII